MQDKENMEQFFDDSWVHMDELLDKHIPVKEKKKRRFAIWWWYGMTTILLAAGFFFWYDNQNVKGTFEPKTVDEMAITKAKEQSKTQHINQEEIAIETNKLNAVFTDEQVAINDKMEQKNTSAIAQSATVNAEDKRKENNLIAPSATNQMQNSKELPSDFKQIAIIDIQESKSNMSERISGKKMDALKLTKKRNEASLVDHLPLREPNMLFAEAEELKGIKVKPKKKLYYELYTGLSQSNVGYNAAFVGFDIGHPIMNRLSVELGLGYRTIFTEKTFIDSTEKALDFFAQASDYNYTLFSSGLGSAIKGKKESLRLHLIELPLKLRFQITPRWSIYGEATGAYQFSKNVPSAVVFQGSNAAGTREKFLPVANLTAHSYIGLGAGVSFGKNHWRWNAGYNNWALFRPDNQYYMGLKYRF